MFIVFVIFAILLLFLFGFGIPVLIEFNTNMYNAGKDVLDVVNVSNLPEDAQDAIVSARDSTPEQISILSFFFEYSWLIVLLVLLFIIYLRSRTLVETEIK